MNNPNLEIKKITIRLGTGVVVTAGEKVFVTRGLLHLSPESVTIKVATAAKL